MNNCQTNTSAAVNELVAAFESLPSWEKRYFYLIELGKQLPSLPSDEHSDALRFNGCQSSVWLTTSLQNQDDGPHLHFLADSDSKIVRGLIAVLHRVYSGQTPDFILNYNIDELFAQLALEQHINAGRRNGLHDMGKCISRASLALTRLDVLHRPSGRQDQRIVASPPAFN